MDKPKRVLIWDVDDVLNHLMRTWLDEWWRPRHSECARSYGHLTANPPHAILGISEDTYLSSLDSFRQERFATLPPCSEAMEWFWEHGHRSHHIALTAVPQSFAHMSAEWVIRHFGQWIRTFAFVPSWREGDGPRNATTSKVDYLAWLGHGDVFIDDRDDNVTSARALGMTGVVVPQPWNTSSSGSLRTVLLNLAPLL